MSLIVRRLVALALSAAVTVAVVGCGDSATKPSGGGGGKTPPADIQLDPSSAGVGGTQKAAPPAAKPKEQ